jgi:hypothetical protein
MLNPIPELHTILSNYRAAEFGDSLPYPAYPELNREFLTRVAAHSASAKHTPEDPATVAAYAALISELRKQFDAFEAAGIRFELSETEPYQNSDDMRSDVRNNRRLKVLKTDNMSGNHPLASEAGIAGWVLNDIFRAVHDLATHAAYGFGFGPRGEDAAYLAHAAVFSLEARPALAAETRLQNAWVNFGPFAHMPVETRPFAEQKAFIPAPEVL